MLSYLRFLLKLKGGYFIYSNIYMITNKINGKKYVGQSKDVEFRWKQHIKDSKHKKLKSRYLYRSFNKYGIENFTLDIIEKDILIEKVNEREIFWINYYNTYAPNGYNLTLGGEGVKGRVFSKEEKERISRRFIIWHKNNKDVFLKAIKERNTENMYSQETIKKRTESWMSNPKNKIKAINTLNTYVNNNPLRTKEEKDEQHIKAVKTKKEKGYDFYNFSFGKMDQNEKDEMYNKISK